MAKELTKEEQQRSDRIKAGLLITAAIHRLFPQVEISINGNNSKEDLSVIIPEEAVEELKNNFDKIMTNYENN